MWMSSVISARRRCEGRTDGSAGLLSSEGVVRGPKGSGSVEGLESERTEDGEIDWFIGCAEEKLDDGTEAVARDMSSTSIGRTYLPSDCV